MKNEPSTEVSFFIKNEDMPDFIHALNVLGYTDQAILAQLEFEEQEINYNLRQSKK
jgi:hypothetical protein